MEPGELLIGGSALLVLLGCRVVARKFILKGKDKDHVAHRDNIDH